MKSIRNYDRYDEYLDHQKEKSLDPKRRKKWLTDEWQEKIDNFTLIFEPYWDLLEESKALCVCARTGQEVAALQDMGVEAVGVDIVEQLPLVVGGDMHDLPFDNETFDFVFSNSFDHSLYPDKFVAEIERVLKPGGYALLHLQTGNTHDAYAENVVVSSEAVIELFANSDVEVDLPMNNNYFKCYDWELLIKKR